MGEKRFLKARNIIIIIISCILIGAAAIGITIYLKDRGEAAAIAEGEQGVNLPETGNDGEEKTSPEENPEGAETEDVTKPETTETSDTAGSVTSNLNTNYGIGGGTPEEEILSGITETTVFEERKIYEDLTLTWTTIAIPAITANMGIYKPELRIEKTAVLVNDVEVTADTKVNTNDIITYEIKVCNIGNCKATNVVVTDSLDINFDGKEIKAGEPIVKLEVLESGKQAKMYVKYTVTDEDTKQLESNEQRIYNIAYATDGRTTVEDDDETIIIQRIEPKITKESVKVNDVTINSEDERNEIKLKENDVVTYEIVVEYNGNVTLTDFSVTDDHNVTVKSIEKVENGSRIVQTELKQNATASNLLGKDTLEPGEKYIITVTYIEDGTINEEDIEKGDKLINTVYLDAAEIKEPLKDDDTLNKYKASNIKQSKESKVIGNEEGDKTVEVGDIIEYIITIENTGNISGNTIVKDALLKENIEAKKIVMIAEDINVISTKPENSTVTDVNTLSQGLQVNIDNGEKYTITFRVKVVGNVLPGDIISNKLEEPDTTTENNVEASLTVHKNLVQPQNTVIVIDLSLSMALAVDFEKGEGPEKDPMADTYESTRWFALTRALDSFLESYMAGEDNKNKVTIIGYHSTALEPLVLNETDLDEAKASYKNILTKTDFENALEKQTLAMQEDPEVKNDVDNLPIYSPNCKLAEGTNIQAGLGKAINVLGNNIKGAQVILMTDGEANRLGDGTETCTVAEAIEAGETKANNLKTAGATLYTVALSISEKTGVVSEEEKKIDYLATLQRMASKDENNKTLCRVADDITELMAYFTEISEAISEQTVNTTTENGIINISNNFKINPMYVSNVEITIPNNDGIEPITLTWAEFDDYYTSTVNGKTIDLKSLAINKGITSITGKVSIIINVDTTANNT